MAALVHGCPFSLERRRLDLVDCRLARLELLALLDELLGVVELSAQLVRPRGRRRPAYEIDHKAEGVYHLLTFDAEPEALAEVSRVLKITDGVMRHLAVKRTDATGPARPLETSVEHRQDSEDQATPVG